MMSLLLTFLVTLPLNVLPVTRLLNQKLSSGRQPAVVLTPPRAAVMAWQGRFLNWAARLLSELVSSMAWQPWSTYLTTLRLDPAWGITCSTSTLQ